jgi:hypothetical protein
VNTERISHPSVDRQASSTPWSVKTFRDRDEWIKLLLAVDVDELSCTAKIVGARTAFHHNVETGQCNPSIGMLVLGTGMSKSTILRMLRELEQKGWLGIDHSRGRHANSFELRAPTVSNVTPFNSVNGDTVESLNSVKCDTVEKSPTVSNVAPQRCQIEPNGVTADTQKRESITANRKAKDIDSLDLGDDDSGLRSQSPSSDSDFEDFYRQYPKHVAKAAALKAYRAVITKGLATAAELEAGALRYAAERSGQDPRFTKHPSTWLHGQCWQDEPAAPITTTIDQNGNPIAAPPNQPRPPWRRESNTERLMRKLQGGA